MKKKKRVKFKILIVLIILVSFIIGIVFIKYNIKDKIDIVSKDMYLASNTNEVMLYTYNKDSKKIKEYKSIPRGILVKSSSKLIVNNTKYIKVEYKDKKYYVLDTNLVESKEDIVKEENRYVRTSLTIYKDKDSYKISSFVKKGNELKINGYDYLNKDGSVNMYNISYGDITGYVYSKYLVNTKEEADMVYNENGIYDIHNGRRYSKELYGGYPENLDYYPYEKPEFKNNKIVKEAKTMYLNASVISDIDSYLEIAKNNGVNAIVVDIKDGSLAYESDVAKEYSQSSYNSKINESSVYKSAIDKIKDSGIYVIGRIVVFNDNNYGIDHPEECIVSTSSNRLWPSAYSRNAWEYNVALALEAIEIMGFNEIQFDYVRFPEDAYRMSLDGTSDFKNVYNEEKAEAIQNFLFYASDQIHKKGAYISVDVFGECASSYVTAYGQYWPAISNIVDAISAMPYTDHFDRNSERWTNPYMTMYNWAKEAVIRQTEIPTPALARTWITAYDTPYWNPTVIYDAGKIEAQVNALYDAGLSGGFITWNSKSSLDKYNQIASSFNKDYSKS